MFLVLPQLEPLSLQTRTKLNFSMDSAMNPIVANMLDTLMYKIGSMLEPNTIWNHFYF